MAQEAVVSAAHREHFPPLVLIVDPETKFKDWDEEVLEGQPPEIQSKASAMHSACQVNRK